MSATSRWLPYRRPQKLCHVRLFCFPFAGGGASVFQTWAADLPAGVELCAVQLPGRENRLSERPLTRVEPLVDAVADGLRPYLDRPFVFFGHSMGGRLAFELARRLRADQGPEPAHLFASAALAPQIEREDDPIHDLPDPQFAERLRSLHAVPEQVLENAELREIFFPVLRADFEVVETYRYVPGPPLTCPISALGGLEDDRLDRARLEAWRAQTAAAFVVRMFPGDHFYLQPQRVLLLQALSSVLTPMVSRLADGTAP